MAKTEYAVQLSKREFDLFRPDSQIAAMRNGGAYGRFTVVEKTDKNSFWGFRFKRKNDAVRFAIWASGWASAYLKTGECALVTLLFD